jgi:uncharacterized protein YqjF (DUF2071 family)
MRRVWFEVRWLGLLVRWWPVALSSVAEEKRRGSER